MKKSIFMRYNKKGLDFAVSLALILFVTGVFVPTNIYSQIKEKGGPGDFINQELIPTTIVRHIKAALGSSLTIFRWMKGMTVLCDYVGKSQSKHLSEAPYLDLSISLTHCDTDTLEINVNW